MKGGGVIVCRDDVLMVLKMLSWCQFIMVPGNHYQLGHSILRL